jgi:hypothetical protein
LEDFVEAQSDADGERLEAGRPSKRGPSSKIEGREKKKRR